MTALPFMFHANEMPRKTKELCRHIGGWRGGDCKTVASGAKLSPTASLLATDQEGASVRVSSKRFSSRCTSAVTARPQTSATITEEIR